MQAAYKIGPNTAGLLNGHRKPTYFHFCPSLAAVGVNSPFLPPLCLPIFLVAQSIKEIYQNFVIIHFVQEAAGIRYFLASFILL